MDSIPVQDPLQFGKRTASGARDRGPLMDEDEIGEDEREQRELELASLFA